MNALINLTSVLESKTYYTPNSTVNYGKFTINGFTLYAQWVDDAT